MDNSFDQNRLELTGGSLGLELARPGNRAVMLHPVVVRPLADADLALLAFNRSTPPVSVKRLSQRHHGLARLIALGTGTSEAAAIMRYEPSRVSVLLSDPAFQELVEFYRRQVDLSFQETVDQMADLSAEALSEIQTRLEDEPEKFEIKDLMQLATSMLDRTGHGPSSTQNQNINVSLGEKLEAARRRAKAARGEIIDAEVKEINPDGSDT